MILIKAMLLFILVVKSCSLCFSEVVTCSNIVPLNHRTDNISILDFGAVGDGKTLNTNAFKDAIYKISLLSKREGGTTLYIPAGVYLTESFNLTSHMTLHLAAGAVIKAIQNSSNWPLIAPLPSYGRGRERPGGRYMSFIHGDGLQDVVITGENGTIDGQGDEWWNMWRNKTLQFTRPGLVEFVNSKDIIISNVTFKDSPFWNIHPVYCSNVVVRFVTILAPHDSPNTDGVDPDSSSNVCIEDSYISNGDDIVAVKRDGTNTEFLTTVLALTSPSDVSTDRLRLPVLLSAAKHQEELRMCWLNTSTFTTWDSVYTLRRIPEGEGISGI
ncbi:hypothetical protein KIW84_020516 [Lathyrus oleraceus]|uniref:Rhamnogalacturonase A/B/Epimerase-like pectate lyase domain-containing protein n=1 Tax=Pisum sativum TaxID=3888 RepID=A0A9D4Y7K3_PEA|nr:hypothetical protein KIW84_020516 [Pisum sativum]